MLRTHSDQEYWGCNTSHREGNEALHLPFCMYEKCIYFAYSLSVCVNEMLPYQSGALEFLLNLFI